MKGSDITAVPHSAQDKPMADTSTISRGARSGRSPPPLLLRALLQAWQNNGRLDLGSNGNWLIGVEQLAQVRPMAETSNICRGALSRLSLLYIIVCLFPDDSENYNEATFWHVLPTFVASNNFSANFGRTYTAPIIASLHQTVKNPQKQKSQKLALKINWRA